MCLLLHCWWCIKCWLSFLSSFGNFKFNASLNREVVYASVLEGKTNPVILEVLECCSEILKALLSDNYTTFIIGNLDLFSTSEQSLRDYNKSSGVLF